MKIRTKAGTVALTLAALSVLAAAPAAASPTCSEEMGIAVHGEHVVSDYVVGDHGTWPPAGGAVGAALKGRGAAVPGGPGPGFHFQIGAAPGASFCVDARSPGWHL